MQDVNFGFYGTVLAEGDKLRMWYHAYRRAPCMHTEVVVKMMTEAVALRWCRLGLAYAESEDGLRWKRVIVGEK